MADKMIRELWIYPVKSLRGISVQAASVRRMGFALDRRWMLVDEAGTFITQREHPELATCALEVVDDAIRIRSDVGDGVSIPVDADGMDLIPVTIWKSRVDAFTCPAEADTFFSDMLRKPVRMVRIPEAAVRRVDPRYATPRDHVSFADGYPVLLTCSASLDDLNARLEEPVPMNRFRPNIVLSTSTPFEEEDWTFVSAPDLTMRLVKPCDRCVITTTDQFTGDRSAEPLRTLSSFRKKGNAVNFGMNCIPDEEGTVHVGEKISVRS